MKMKFTTLLWLLCCASLLLSQRAIATNQCQFAKKVGELPDRLYQFDGFSIYYATTGEHALVHQADMNHNGIPDQVEDIALQLSVARKLYNNSLGLVDPLKQPRYEEVEGIRIRLMNIKNNGQAFDEPHRFPDQKSSGRCSLMIKMSNRLDEGTFTPVHELFHLYQYGYTMFKQRWFLEGMARWAESVLNDKTLDVSAIPSEQALPEFFNKTYSASGVWQKLAMQSDPVGLLVVAPNLLDVRYVDGRKVIEDQQLYGIAFIRHVLQGFSDYDHQVSRQRGLDYYHWDEALQQDEAFNQVLWQTVLRH